MQSRTLLLPAHRVLFLGREERHLTVVRGIEKSELLDQYFDFTCRILERLHELRQNQ